ncbi:MAG: glycosyltransferase family 2 protein [Bacteroidales bacterium]|nr:glycosyltransferase family 2 protein [Bacteroidales bacterium]MDD4236486.1 glycosyltransferase family 2 protein [Bacteroidales bacterium]
MLSICIPVYNKKVKRLHSELIEAAKLFTLSYEIIIIDDASKDKYRIENSQLQSNNTKYIQLDKNIGRAAIRNLFTKYANFEYLLFLDCDSRLVNNSFLENYAKILHNNHKIILGGSIYPNIPPTLKYRLHWKYGKKHESLSNNKLKQAVLKTNNFIIKTSILQNHRFDLRVKGYGHEDTLMGVQLKKAGYEIFTFNNPVINSEPDHNIVFLRKTEQAVKNLWNIIEFTEDKQLFINEVKLLRTYYKIKKPGLIPLLKLIAIVKLKPIRYLLCIGFNSIFLFNIYKLLILIKSKPKSL